MPIRILPQHLVNQLAAGEVVERPASVAKELIENAIDANASQVEVAFEQGGLARISVTDNGSGMTSGDLEMALLPHATSKMPEDGRFNIVHLGFRGEALAAIGSVSVTEVSSRTEESDCAWLVRSVCGNRSAVTPSRGGRGTRIVVSDLFRNIPARLKFMRSETAEAAQIVKTVGHLAVAHPGVGFILTGKKRVFSVVPVEPGSQAERSRLSAVMGPDFSSEAWYAADCGVDAWIRLPPNGRKPKPGRQIVVVNGRPVQDRSVALAIRAAAEKILGQASSLEYVVRINVDRQEVDVNTHPAKSEVRFLYPDRICRVVGDVVESCLRSVAGERAGRFAEFVRQAVESSDTTTRNVRLPLGRPIGQAHDRWVVSETPDGICLIDQHAAHERILLERLRAAIAADGLSGRPLPAPVTVHLGAPGAAVINDWRQQLTRCGFDFELSSLDTVRLKSVPEFVDARDAEGLLLNVAEDLQRFVSQDQFILHDVLSKAACSMAIKAGDGLSREALEAFLKELSSTPEAVNCNHGRPAVIFLTNEEIGRLFERR